MSGILYGVGVGPGDPELLTIKAVRLIRENQVIAAPGENVRETTAYKIAVQAVPELEDKEHLPLFMPMVMDRKKGRLLGILAMIFAALIGYSRLYVGVHFPTDVLGGAILGVLYGIAGFYLGKKLIGVIERKWPHVFPTDPAAGTQGSGPKAGA